MAHFCAEFSSRDSRRRVAAQPCIATALLSCFGTMHRSAGQQRERVLREPGGGCGFGAGPPDARSQDDRHEEGVQPVHELTHLRRILPTPQHLHRALHTQALFANRLACERFRQRSEFYTKLCTLRRRSPCYAGSRRRVERFLFGGRRGVQKNVFIRRLRDAAAVL